MRIYEARKAKDELQSAFNGHLVTNSPFKVLYRGDMNNNSKNQDNGKSEFDIYSTFPKTEQMKRKSVKKNLTTSVSDLRKLFEKGDATKALVVAKPAAAEKRRRESVPCVSQLANDKLAGNYIYEIPKNVLMQKWNNPAAANGHDLGQSGGRPYSIAAANCESIMLDVNFSLRWSKFTTNGALSRPLPTEFNQNCKCNHDP